MLRMARVGQARIYTPCMTVCMVISLLKVPYIQRIYVHMWPTLHTSQSTHLFGYKTIKELTRDEQVGNLRLNFVHKNDKTNVFGKQVIN